MNDLLLVRKKVKARKPKFIRQQGQHLTSLSKNWRAPKGMHSKTRRKRRGKMRHPTTGFGSPREVMHFHPSGLKPLLVTHQNQLGLVTKEHGIILSRTMGKKKKLVLLKIIEERKLPLLNIKDIASYKRKAEEEKKKKKEISLEKQKKKQKPKKEEIQKEKKELTNEEKEKIEKEEKRKVLEGKKQ